MTTRLRFTFSFFMAVVLMTGCATAPAPTPERTSPAVPTQLQSGHLPPLLDRELFFGDPEISGAQVSPDGRYISFIKPYRGVRNVWVKRIDEPFSAARPLTADMKRPVQNYFWSEDGRYVLYAQDKGGNENYLIYAVDPAASAEPSTGVPPARNLTPLENVRAAIYALPENRPNEIIIGLNDRKPAVHDVYRLDLTTGERTLLIPNDHNVADWEVDRQGNLRLAVRQTPDGGTEFLPVHNGQLGPAIYTCTWEETCNPVRFNRQGNRIYITSNQGADIDRTRLMLLDVQTGAVEIVEADPQNEVDFGGAFFSDATEELAVTIYVGDRLRVYARDPQYQRDLDMFRAKLPDGDLRLVSITNDDNIMLVNVAGDVNPGSVYVYNRSRGTLEHLYDLRPDLPKEHLASMQPIRYRARDGRTIPAYLTLPRGVPGKNLPTVIYPHGGPWARDLWGFSSYAQFLANRGYAVLSPNFRGSTGYGKSFLNAGNTEWGVGAMQHDITDGVQYLIDQGIADPKRIGIMGGSYGGYATLAGVTFTPDLYAAAVDIVGPSNLSTLIRSFPAYWGPMIRTWHIRVGNPDNPADVERLKAQSPLYFASRIKTPLLLIHGANDPRVKQAESDQIIAELRDHGRHVEYIVAPDEGHGFAGRENRLAMVAVIERFLAKHLGGRYQESMKPEIRARVDAITVDIGKVQRPRLTETGAFVTPNK